MNPQAIGLGYGKNSFDFVQLNLEYCHVTTPLRKETRHLNSTIRSGFSYALTQVPDRYTLTTE